MTESRMQMIEDREAIRDLLARYCYLIAAGDVDGVIELYTLDCVVDVRGNRFEGARGLQDLYADSLQVSPKPYIHNHLIDEISADSARGRCVLEIRQIRAGKPETAGGCYEDRYLKQDGRWKFHHRTFRVY